MPREISNYLKIYESIANLKPIMIHRNLKMRKNRVQAGLKSLSHFYAQERRADQFKSLCKQFSKTSWQTSNLFSGKNFDYEILMIRYT